MERITNIAVIGCGVRTSLLIGGILSRLCGNYRITIHVASVKAVETAMKRLSGALSREPDARVKFEVTTAPHVSPDTHLVLSIIGRDVTNVGPADTLQKLRAMYCLNLGPETIVLEHTAEFPALLDSTSGRPQTGLFHFLYPADLMGLIEIGMPGFSDHERGLVAEFFNAAGLYPLIQQRWPVGFLSNRFQLKLLEAISRVIDKKLQITSDVSKSIDRAIAVVVVQLYRALWNHPDGNGVFDHVASRRDEYLEHTPEYAPLWEAFESTWNELKDFWTEREVAWALLTGPALRCVHPGFLKFIDTENLAPFLYLLGKICPGGDDDILWRLISEGRNGVQAPYVVYRVQYVDGGFYTRGLLAEHLDALARERKFLLRHRLLQRLQAREEPAVV